MIPIQYLEGKREGRIRMSKFTVLPVGSKVSIVPRKMRPDNWNNDMMAMGGEVVHITSNGAQGIAGKDTDYRYRIDKSEWVWRHIDFILIEPGKVNPNSAFRSKKLGY